jgi:hypothetical protein
MVISPSMAMSHGAEPRERLSHRQLHLRILILNCVQPSPRYSVGMREGRKVSDFRQSHDAIVQCRIDDLPLHQHRILSQIAIERSQAGMNEQI